MRVERLTVAGSGSWQGAGSIRPRADRVTARTSRARARPTPPCGRASSGSRPGDGGPVRRPRRSSATGPGRRRATAPARARRRSRAPSPGVGLRARALHTARRRDRRRPHGGPRSGHRPTRLARTLYGVERDVYLRLGCVDQAELDRIGDAGSVRHAVESALTQSRADASAATAVEALRSHRSRLVGEPGPHERAPDSRVRSGVPAHGAPGRHGGAGRGRAGCRRARRRPWRGGRRCGAGARARIGPRPPARRRAAPPPRRRRGARGDRGARDRPARGRDRRRRVRRRGSDGRDARPHARPIGRARRAHARGRGRRGAGGRLGSAAATSRRRSRRSSPTGARPTALPPWKRPRPRRAQDRRRAGPSPRSPSASWAPWPVSLRGCRCSSESARWPSPPGPAGRSPPAAAAPSASSTGSCRGTERAVSGWRRSGRRWSATAPSLQPSASSGGSRSSWPGSARVWPGPPSSSTSCAGCTGASHRAPGCGIETTDLGEGLRLYDGREVAAQMHAEPTLTQDKRVRGAAPPPRRGVAR